MTQQIFDMDIIPQIEPLSIKQINPAVYWRRLSKYRGLILAVTALLLITLPISFAGYLTPHEPIGVMNLSDRNIPPFWIDGGTLKYPLGTDNLGRDVLSQTLYGGQISLQVAFVAGTISAIIGLMVGMVGGYMGGLLDRILIGLTDIWLSFPFLVMALAVIATIGNSVVIMITLLSLMGWVHAARVTRINTIQLMQSEYVQASISFGAKPLHIIWYHILPNVLNVNIVIWTFSIGTLVVVESSLSFIGFGVSSGTPSWGSMMSTGQDYLRSAWWISFFPGLVLMLTVIAVNFLGDAIQDLNNHHFNPS
jgi:peptide/nickel transport system permease protein